MHERGETAMEGLGLALAIFIIPVVILIIICCVGVAAQKNKIDSLPDERNSATVVSMRSTYSGAPAYRTYTYYILFQLEDGQRIEYPVNSDWYHQLVVGDTGTLINRGKYFYSFERT